MKKWEVVLAVILSLLMVVTITVGIVTWVMDKTQQSAVNAPTAGDEITEPTKAEGQEADEHEHTQQVIIAFVDGVMRCNIKEQCKCGEETVFGNVSRTKEAALNIISIIKCEHEVFFIKENADETPITREDLIQRVNEYEFKNAES